MSEPEREIEERLSLSVAAYHEAALVYTAVKLNLAEKMGAASWRAKPLAAALGLSAPHLGRFLRGLCIIGLCEERADGSFALTRAGRSLMPGSRLAMKVEIVVEQYWQPWANLILTLHNGVPAFERVFGASVFDWRRAHHEQGALFASYLAKENASALDTIIEAVDLAGVATVAVLQSQSQFAGETFDSARMVELSRPFSRLFDVASRVEFVPGNLLEEIPVEADLYLLIGVLQQFADADAATILKNCRAAMRDGARLVIAERLLPARATDDPGAVMLDLHMMTITGGRARTLADFETLLSHSGLAPSNVKATRTGLSIIESTG